MTHRQLVTFAQHLIALVIGAATPALVRIADNGLNGFTLHQLALLGQAELAALIFAGVAYATPLVRAYGVGSEPVVPVSATSAAVIAEPLTYPPLPTAVPASTLSRV